MTQEATVSVEQQPTAARPAGGIRALATARTDIFQIDPRILEVDTSFNARDFSTPSNIDHVAWLERSIASEGVREPLRVRTNGNRLIITNGESRLRAVMNLIRRFDETNGAEGANIASVPVRTEERASNDADRLFTQLTSNSGKRFEAIEQSDLFSKMIKLGLTVDDIIERSGLEKRRVQTVLDLQSLPFQVQKMIRKEQVPSHLAMEIFVKNDRDEEKTISDLAGALTQAEASGRTRATRRFVGERKPTQLKVFKEERQEIADILGQAYIDFEPAGGKDDDKDATNVEQHAGQQSTDGTINIVISADKWARMRAILDI